GIFAVEEEEHSAGSEAIARVRARMYCESMRLVSSPKTSSAVADAGGSPTPPQRSEEHTSELQSQSNLVCRLLLEKKKKNNKIQEVKYIGPTKQKIRLNLVSCNQIEILTCDDYVIIFS